MIFNVKFLSFATLVLLSQIYACSSTCLSPKACKRVIPCIPPLCASSSLGLSQTQVDSPVKSPVQSPVQAPVETLAQTPVQSPIQAPVQTPVQTPVQSPVQSPVQTFVQTPIASGCLFKSFCGKKKQPTKAITGPVDGKALLAEIGKVKSKSLKYGAVSAAVLSAPAIFTGTKVTLLASKIPVVMAVKGAIVGAMIAKPIKKAAIIKTALKVKAIGKAVAIPFAAYAGVKSLMLVKKYKIAQHQQKKLLKKQPVLPASPVKGYEQPLQAPVKSLVQQEPLQEAVQAPVKDVAVQEPVKSVPVKSPEVVLPSQDTV